MTAPATAKAGHLSGAKRFVISDLHLGHKNILTFKLNDGITPLRDFPSIEEMHQRLEDNWNKVVRDFDKVYVLGDVVINKKWLEFLPRLKGKKSLVRGNHDIFPLDDYRKYFYDVQGVKVITKWKVVLTHVPVHPDCLNRPAWQTNLHGHLHGNEITRQDWVPESGYAITKPVKDERYINCCVEKLNYTPVEIPELLEKHGRLTKETA